MKAKLIFDLDDHDDKMGHMRAIKALDMALALWEIIYNTKKDCEWKIEEDEKMSSYDVLDMIYEKISDILEEHSINIDDLVE